MREWINLIESFHVPDAREFVTDALIDRILSTGAFVPHGGSDGLERWIGEARSWDLFSGQFGDEPVEELRRGPAFREFFKGWMRDLRAPYVNRCLQGLTPQTWVARGMYVRQDWLDSLARPDKGAMPLGIYWTLGEAVAFNASDAIKKENPVEITLATHLADVIVDWQHTFESRFDYEHGDNEEEIQLAKGSFINNVEIHYCGNRGGEVPVDPSRTFIA